MTGATGTAGTTANTVATSQTTTSTTYTDLATTGPAVTVTIPASGNALVILTASQSDGTNNQGAYMAFAVSGATTRAASDTTARIVKNGTGSSAVQGSATFFVTGLTAGSNTFTAKYRVTGGTGTFLNRTIIVIPLP